MSVEPGASPPLLRVWTRMPLPAPIKRLSARLFGGDAARVYRGMGVMLLGAGGARLVDLGTIPLLTRLFSPADYGVLSVFISLVAMITPVVGLRYVLAFPLPRQDRMAINLLALSVLLTVVLSGALSLLLWAWGAELLRLLSMEALTSWSWLIVLGVLASALYEQMSLWGTRRRAYGVIAKSQVTQSLAGAAVKLTLGALGVKPMGLLTGQVVALGGGVGAFLAHFRDEFLGLRGHVRLSRMWFLAGFYRDFPIYRLPSQFLLVFSTQAPMLFTAAQYDASTAGQLGLAFMTMTVPLRLIGTTIGNAYYGEISRARNDPRKIWRITFDVQKKLFAFGLPIAAVIFFLGEPIFALVFGREWTEAGLYASALAAYMLLQFTSTPLVQVLNIYNGQRLFLVINVVRSAALAGLFAAVHLQGWSAQSFVTILSGLLFVFYCVITLMVMRITHARARDAGTDAGSRVG